MDFDDQMQRYFGATDLDAVNPAALEAGKERLAVDFGLEQDRGRKFAMWALMHILGNAPDLDVAFKEASDRNAARDFMEMLGRLSDA